MFNEQKKNVIAPDLELKTPLPKEHSVLGTSIKFAVFSGTFAIAAIGYYYFYEHLELNPQHQQLSTVLDRIIYAVQLEVYSLLMVILTLKVVVLGRLFSAAYNPLSGNEGKVAKASRIFVNTMEQFVIHFFNVFIFSTWVPEEYLFVLPGIVAAFVFGRVAFFVGYMIHPKHRLLGFVWTVVPTVALFFVNITSITVNRFFKK